MDINSRIALHPNFLERLFGYKSKVRAVFRDVLGLHEISHFAISLIDSRCMLSTLSSTPALEFNLFNSKLWRFDKTYQPSWVRLGTKSPWQSLYTADRYDELYYLKQIKHRYPVGLSLSVKSTDAYLIYSIASHKESSHMQEFYMNQCTDLYKMGEYCSKALLPLLSG